MTDELLPPESHPATSNKEASAENTRHTRNSLCERVFLTDLPQPSPIPKGREKQLRNSDAFAIRASRVSGCLDVGGFTIFNSQFSILVLNGPPVIPPPLEQQHNERADGEGAPEFGVGWFRGAGADLGVFAE